MSRSLGRRLSFGGVGFEADEFGDCEAAGPAKLNCALPFEFDLGPDGVIGYYDAEVTATTAALGRTGKLTTTFTADGIEKVTTTADVTVAEGDTVTLPVGTRNNGPVTRDASRVGSPAATVIVTIPARTKVVTVPEGCNKASASGSPKTPTRRTTPRRSSSTRSRARAAAVRAVAAPCRSPARRPLSWVGPAPFWWPAVLSASSWRGAAVPGSKPDQRGR